MVSFVVAAPGPWRRPGEQRRELTRLALLDEAGRNMITFPWSPQVVDHGELSATHADGQRDGRAPLLLYSGAPRPTLSFEVLLADRSGSADIEVEHYLNALKTIAARNARLRIAYGPGESAGLWRMTSFSYATQMRNYRGMATRAVAQLGFTRAVDAAVNRGPLSGGAKPPAAAKTAAKPGAKPAPARTHVVKSGDTLAKIAVAYYRDASKWSVIATKNGIRDPKQLPIGKRLVIP